MQGRGGKGQWKRTGEKKNSIKATHTICSLGYRRSRRTSPVLVHEGTFSLCDTLKKTAEYKCPHYSYTPNSDTTALAQNASQTVSTNIHVTFFSPVYIRKATTGTAGQAVQSFLLQNIFLSRHLCKYKTLSRPRSFFFSFCYQIWTGNAETECVGNWIQLLSRQQTEIFRIT